MADVVIAGGGIGGIVLADLLCLGGKHVVVIEKSTSPPPWVRPEILWPATMDALYGLRPQAFWENERCLVPLRGIECGTGDRTFPLISEDTIQSAGVRPVSAEPNKLREALLRTCQGEVRRGFEVTGLRRCGGKVTGLTGKRLTDQESCEVEARWIVGDDGMHSRVRTEANIHIELRSFPVDFLVRRFSRPAELAKDLGHAFLVPRKEPGLRAFGLLPQGPGIGAGVALVDETEKTTEILAAQWESFVGDHAQLPEEVRRAEFPSSFARIHRVFGHAARYGSENVILLGDALHPVSPAGGQGANMAVADALVLARLLLDGGRDVSSRYEALRRPANARSLRITKLAARFFSAPSTQFSRAAGAAALAFLVGHPKLVAWQLRRISGAFKTPR
ncbi:MAG: FAD-dependent oxidoreductase [Verrucomicrobiales bacterium]